MVPSTRGYQTMERAAVLINNEMGTYVSKLTPRGTKGMMFIDPFARAGTALTRTGLKRIVGRDTSGKFSWEIFSYLRHLA